MNKEEYYLISEKKKLPLRCPILNYCERRALTMYAFNYRDAGSGNPIKVLKREGAIPQDFEKKEIPIQGETVSWIVGHDSFWFENACPEVALFDNENRPVFAKQTACASGAWDNDNRQNKYTCSQTKHYCECSEFSYSIHNKKIKISSTRPRISPKTKALLQKEIHSVCPFCPSEEVGHFEIHHIDENPQNNEIANLLMLCRNCHSKITKGDIIEEEVFKVKIMLSKSSYNPKISEVDQQVVQHLFELLDLKLFQEEIVEHDGWYGYLREPIMKMLAYKEASTLLKNRIINNDLFILFQDFNNALDEFNYLASNSVYGKTDLWYGSMHEDRPEERKKNSIQLNKLSKKAFLKLESIIIFLKKNHITI